jgi:hypothetical protein
MPPPGPAIGVKCDQKLARFGWKCRLRNRRLLFKLRGLAVRKPPSDAAMTSGSKQFRVVVATILWAFLVNPGERHASPTMISIGHV